MLSEALTFFNQESSVFVLTHFYCFTFSYDPLALLRFGTKKKRNINDFLEEVHSHVRDI
jgi:hypothetical protein